MIKTLIILIITIIEMIIIVMTMIMLITIIIISTYERPEFGSYCIRGSQLALANTTVLMV